MPSCRGSEVCLGSLRIKKGRSVKLRLQVSNSGELGRRSWRYRLSGPFRGLIVKLYVSPDASHSRSNLQNQIPTKVGVPGSGVELRRLNFDAEGVIDGRQSSAVVADAERTLRRKPDAPGIA